MDVYISGGRGRRIEDGEGQGQGEGEGECFCHEGFRSARSKKHKAMMLCGRR